MRKIAVLSVVIIIFLVAVPTLYMNIEGSGSSSALTVNNTHRNFAWAGDFRNSSSTSSPVLFGNNSVTSTFTEGTNPVSNLTATVSGNAFNASSGITIVLNVKVTGSIYGSHIPGNLTLEVNGGNLSAFQSNFVEMVFQKYSSTNLKLSFPQSGTSGVLPITPVFLKCNFKSDSNSSQKSTGPATFTINTLLYLVVSTHVLEPFNLGFQVQMNGLSKAVSTFFSLQITQTT